LGSHSPKVNEEKTRIVRIADAMNRMCIFLSSSIYKPAFSLGTMTALLLPIYYQILYRKNNAFCKSPAAFLIQNPQLFKLCL
jgi:hypothetical protein